MRVLLTGAAGLYGYHTLRELSSWNQVSKIVGLDDFSRGFPQEEEFMSGPWGAKVQIIKQRYQDCTVKEINSLNVDVVVHLAAFDSGKESINTPEEYFLNNEYGAFQFIQTLLRTRNKPYLIFASTTELYGSPVYVPVDERHPVNPLNVYAVTKLAAERHIMAAGKAFSYPVTSLRFTNTYGENQNVYGYTSVVTSFIDRALRNEPLIIYGTGEQTRDFLYAKDAARAVCAAIVRLKQAEGRVLNIATGRLTKIRDLAKKIIRLAEAASEIINLPCEREELQGAAIDSSQALKILGWKPDYQLEEGLLNTIDWYKCLYSV